MIADRRATVMAVDDRPENLLSLQAVLEPLGVVFLSARSGEEAIRLAKDNDIAAVILDVRMPGMDGFETAGRLRELDGARQTPILFVTASELDERQAARGFALGAVDYLTKPLDPDALRGKVAAYLDLFDRTRELQSRLRATATQDAATVLVVNDDAGGLLAMEADLAPLGRQVRIMTARSGREALSLILRHSPALVVLDVHMPDMSGFEVAEAIKQSKRHRDIPIVFLSATADAESDVPKGYAVGAVDFLFMPIRPELLCAKVKAILDQFWQRRVLQEFAEETSRLNRALEASARDLESANGTLEARVKARTAELARSNEELQVALAEQRRSVEERQALQQQLTQAQKMETVGRLAGGVAHDFNNMLGVIIGYGERMVQQLPVGDPLRSEAGEIVRAGRQSAQLTRQLLAFARQQALRPEVLDLNALLRDARTMLGRMIGEDVEIELSPSGATAMVLADPGQVQQVVVNLAVNARDAMPRGGHLRIETTDVELDGLPAVGGMSIAPGPYVRLAFTDTGIGMSEETLARAFDPFFTTKPMGHGTGLGLSTVYGIVTQSGGSVAIRSEIDRGTTVEVFLPRGSEEPSARDVGPAEPVRLVGGEHILIVEDEGSLRTLFAKGLSGLGYRASVAADGHDAVRLISEAGLRPDLVIIDAIMPGMPGPVVADALRRVDPDLKVLFMSGYASDAIVEHSGLDPSAAFIQKPFTIGDLAAAARRVMDEGTTAPTSDSETSPDEGTS